jgi:hypothetical protein
MSRIVKREGLMKVIGCGAKLGDNTAVEVGS